MDEYYRITSQDMGKAQVIYGKIIRPPADETGLEWDFLILSGKSINFNFVDILSLYL